MCTVWFDGQSTSMCCGPRLQTTFRQSACRCRQTTAVCRAGRVCQCTCGQPSQSFFVTQKACSFTSGCSRGKSKRGGTLADGSCAQEQSQIFSSLADAGCSAASLSCSCQWPQAQNK